MAPPRSLAMALALLAASTAAALADDKPVEIPLKDIWANKMPGTRDISDLQPKGYVQPGVLKEGSKALGEIFEALGYRHWPKEGDSAGSCFAVSGTGYEALEAARDVFLKKTERPEKLPANQEVTLAFYDYYIGYYLHLKEVKRSCQIIVIGYYLVPHHSKELTSHLALIPLGKLTSGKYDVIVTKIPLPEEYARFRSLDEATVRRFVCHSSSFEVVVK